MIFTFDRDAMLKEIAIAQEIVAMKNPLSILSNVLLIAENNALTIKATETRTNFETKLPVEVREEGSTTVFCDKFIGILNSLPQGDIEFNQEDITVTIKPMAKNARFQLKSIAGDKFPTFSFDENRKFFEISSGDLKEMISHTIGSVSDDETRYFMNGVYFDQREGKLRLVATDGRRLAYAEKIFPWEGPDLPKVIVPPKVLNVLLKRAPSEGNVKVSIDEKTIFFEFGNYKLSSLLIDGQFPNYQKVIPENQAHFFETDKNKFQEALKGVANLMEQRSQKILFELTPGVLVIAAKGNDIGNADEEIPCEYTGEDVTIAMNYTYVSEPLKTLNAERVRFEFTEKTRAVTMRPEPASDYFHIIMPMQSE